MDRSEVTKLINEIHEKATAEEINTMKALLEAKFLDKGVDANDILMLESLIMERSFRTFISTIKKHRVN